MMRKVVSISKVPALRLASLGLDVREVCYADFRNESGRVCDFSFGGHFERVRIHHSLMGPAPENAESGEASASTYIGDKVRVRDESIFYPFGEKDAVITAECGAEKKCEIQVSSFAGDGAAWHLAMVAGNVTSLYVGRDSSVFAVCEAELPSEMWNEKKEMRYDVRLIRKKANGDGFDMAQLQFEQKEFGAIQAVAGDLAGLFVVHGEAREPRFSIAEFDDKTHILKCKTDGVILKHRSASRPIRCAERVGDFLAVASETDLSFHDPKTGELKAWLLFRQEGPTIYSLATEDGALRVNTKATDKPKAKLYARYEFEAPTKKPEKIGGQNTAEKTGADAVVKTGGSDQPVGGCCVIL